MDVMIEEMRKNSAAARRSRLIIFASDGLFTTF